MSKQNKPSPKTTKHPSGEAKKQDKSSSFELVSMTNFLVVLVLILPFLFSKKLIDPAIAIRYIFLGIGITLFIVTFILVSKKKITTSFPLPIKVIFILGILYSCWNMVSLTNAINAKEGYYIISRQLLNLIVLFVAMITAVHEEKGIIKIAKALVIVAIGQSLVGILQFYKIAFTDLPGNYIPYGLMANRNLFGSAQMLLIPFCILVLAQAEKNWKYLAGIALTGLIISVFISQTRSAWLSSVIIGIVSFTLVIVFAPASRKKWLMGSGISLVGVTAVIGILFFTSKNSEFTASIKDRLVTSSEKTDTITNADENVSDRVAIWNKTIELIKKEPITGVGSGNWRIAVPALGTKGLAWEDGSYVPDRAHNFYLQTASETGIPGALIYFTMWILIGWLGLKIILKTKSDERKIIVSLLLAGMAGFAVDSNFSFPEERIEHFLYFTIMAGLILGIYQNQFHKVGDQQIAISKPIGIVMLIIIGFNIFIGYKKYNFEVHSNYAKAYEKAKKYKESLREAEAGKNSFITLDPNGKPIEIYSSLSYQKTKDYEKAIVEAEIAKKLNPNSFMVYNNMGTIYTEMGNFEEAVKYYKQALEFAPKFKLSLFNLAINYFQLKKYQECLDILNTVNWKENETLVAVYNECTKQVSTVPVQ